MNGHLYKCLEVGMDILPPLSTYCESSVIVWKNLDAAENWIKGKDMYE